MVILISVIVLTLFIVNIYVDDEMNKDKEINSQGMDNNNSSEYFDSDIEEALNGFEERRRKQQREKEKKRSREKRLKKVSANAIERIIVPVLEEIRKGISKEGYWCSLSKEIEGKMHPYVELKFKPQKGFTRSCSIRFEHIKPCKILMREKIKTDSFNGRKMSVEVDSMEEEWVKKQTTVFIESALREY